MKAKIDNLVFIKVKNFKKKLKTSVKDTVKKIKTSLTLRNDVCKIHI